MFSFSKTLLFVTLAVAANAASLGGHGQASNRAHHGQVARHVARAPADSTAVPQTLSGARARRVKRASCRPPQSSSAAAPTSSATPTPSPTTSSTPVVKPTSEAPPPPPPAPKPTTHKETPTPTPTPSPTPPPPPPAPKPKPTPTTTKQADPAPTQGGGGSTGGTWVDGKHTGEVTYYATGMGACGIVNTDADYIAAVSIPLFDGYPGYKGGNPNNNPICGRKINAVLRGKPVTIAVTDRCEACKTWDLDMSPTAFGKIADFSEGRVGDMTWTWA